jgi:hypothetical protein
LAWFPKLPLVLLPQALPEPKRRKDALVKISIGHFRIQYFSKLMKFIAKAAIPDAEEATRTVGTYFVCRL